VEAGDTPVLVHNAGGSTLIEVIPCAQQNRR
jgi:hypothetical protein